MVLIKNFKSTNVWNAFILNSITTTIIIILAITINNSLDKYILHIEIEPTLNDKTKSQHET